MPNVPKSILRNERSHNFYKYHKINSHLFESLINQTLWFSKNSMLNDPFENNKPINYGSDEETIRQHIHIAFGIGFDEKLPTDLELLASKWNNNPKYVEEYLKKEISTQLGEYGMCCFSEISNSILMWSHYANGHRGVCLEFNISIHNLFSDSTNSHNIYPYKVNYPEPNTYQELFDPSIPIDESLIGYLLTKSHDWNYEKELRIFGQTGNRKFNKNCLSAIIFGCNVDKNQKQTIINLCSNAYPNISYIQMEIDNLDYKLNPRRL